MKILNITKKTISIIVLIALFIAFILFIVLKSIGSDTIIMTPENFTMILKNSHDNPYHYMDKRIISSGYVFRLNDFKDNQFVVARDMLVSKNESRIVGFLCESEKISEFESNEWIQIDGVFTVGDYHGAMPIIKVNTIKRINTPNDVFVLPPKK